jgi:SSS family solute:Na+ symporter
VPAAIMSIAAANLWTRNIYKEYLRRDATSAQEAKQAKLASLVVKFGAVAFILFINPQFSIDLQLIGGVLILQTLPTVALTLYTRWLHRWGLIAGWVVGMIWGLIMLYDIPNPKTGRAHFGGSALPLGNLSIFGWHPFGGSQIQIYPGFVAVVANLVVAVVVTVIARAAKVSNGTDETEPSDYHADEHDKNLRPVGGARTSVEA